ncbi:protein FLUORESCENT IN BLUE LIGHT, chloroplastic isoform X1 [Malania oleifera]|uniref:protein FLUORESCENT IN BLUE LIGHT, chloroplastic isoform X1 n=1 Tax=Malania oleifera TaxID=397392 RepID=UPI0025ADC6B0|nr:protein FLUORESCENT IN BLUE LIGHT, chloroplastic isoform X1 [Malania oleifera]
MAVVVVRYSSSLPIPSVSGHISRLPLKFAPKPRFYVKKCRSSFRYALCGAFEIPQILRVRQSLHIGFDALQTSKAEASYEIDKDPPNYDAISTDTTHQGVLALQLPPMALLMINALILTMPPEALAETCEVDNSTFNMPLLLFVALIGATVGGLLARQRRGELERLNEQLRQINTALRRQAKIESYAPGLSYAPVGGRIAENEVIVDPRKQELISHLKTGKNFLRNQDPEKAFVEFKTALELSQNLKDPIEAKKAARGLGASLQRQGKYREAIKYHSMVLAISEREGEESGNTEAYGAIADCYTELGDLERAGKFYDKYIARLETD